MNYALSTINLEAKNQRKLAMDCQHLIENRQHEIGGLELEKREHEANATQAEKALAYLCRPEAIGAGKAIVEMSSGHINIVDVPEVAA